MAIDLSVPAEPSADISKEDLDTPVLCLDLDALPEAFPAKEGWGLNRRAFVSFRETDYLRAVTGARLADRLRHLVFQRLENIDQDFIFLLILKQGK